MTAFLLDGDYALGILTNVSYIRHLPELNYPTMRNVANKSIAFHTLVHFAARVKAIR